MDDVEAPTAAATSYSLRISFADGVTTFVSANTFFPEGSTMDDARGRTKETLLAFRDLMRESPNVQSATVTASGSVEWEVSS